MAYTDTYIESELVKARDARSMATKYTAEKDEHLNKALTAMESRNLSEFISDKVKLTITPTHTKRVGKDGVDVIESITDRLFTIMLEGSDFEKEIVAKCEEVLGVQLFEVLHGLIKEENSTRRNLR